MYALDTDMCIYLLNGRAPEAAERMRDIPADSVGVTSITAGELRYGALRSGRTAANLERVERFLAPLARLVFDDRAAVHFAEIKSNLATRGDLIGPMDLLIAATVRSRGATLITNNTREFERVSGLSIDNWSGAPKTTPGSA